MKKKAIQEVKLLNLVLPDLNVNNLDSDFVVREREIKGSKLILNFYIPLLKNISYQVEEFFPIPIPSKPYKSSRMINFDRRVLIIRKGGKKFELSPQVYDQCKNNTDVIICEIP